GGSWDHYPQNCRVAYRFNYTPGSRNNNIGFRLARTL
ncbi:MAG: SUMF1/EgtB/PvdO family nonheme iron enzyme, partial [Saprospiraceae bacterium]